MLFGTSHSDLKGAICILGVLYLYVTGVPPLSSMGYKYQGTFLNVWSHFWWPRLSNVTGIWWIEVRDATKHPTHRTCPAMENYLGQNASSVALEKPCCIQTALSERRTRHFNLLMTVQSVISSSQVIFKPGLLIQQIKQLIDQTLLYIFHCRCSQKV